MFENITIMRLLKTAIIIVFIIICNYIRTNDCECLNDGSFVHCNYSMLYKPTGLKINHNLQYYDRNYGRNRRVENMIILTIFSSFILSFTSETLVSNELNTLLINDCHLNEICSDAFSHLNTLKKIDFSNNNISVLENNAFNLPNLKILNLSNNSITNISQNVLILPLLEYLDLSNNHISTMEYALHNLPSLLNLNLQFNYIFVLGNNLFQNLYLVDIDLSFNNISKIKSNCFTGLSSLNKLNLKFNYLKIIEANSFNPLIGMDTIYFSHNNISSINNLTGTDRTKYLYLDHNFIESLDYSTFNETKSLLHLNLSYNLIKVIPKSVFANLEQLSLLDISYNLITDINVGTFVGLVSLTHLYLTGNKIRNISPNIFHNTPNLEILSLKQNLISNISAKEFSQFTALKSISISNNNFKCDQLSNILHSFKQYNVEVEYGAPNGEISIQKKNVHGIDCDDQQIQTIWNNTDNETLGWYFSNEKSQLSKWLNDVNLIKKKVGKDVKLDESLDISNDKNDVLKAALQKLTSINTLLILWSVTAIAACGLYFLKVVFFKHKKNKQGMSTELEHIL